MTWIGGLARDFRLAVRELRRSWAFTAVTVATLALGIGANTTMFAVADAVLFRALPFEDPGRLVIAAEQLSGAPRAEVSYLNFADWRQRATSFEGLAAIGSSNWTLTLDAGEPRAVPYRAVSGEFFDVLGARAAIGRALTRDDDQVGVPRVVVISHGLWQRAFGAAADVVGRGVTIDRTPFTIIGVMPREFRYPAGAEAWAPVVPALGDVRRDDLPSFLNERRAAVLHVLGRLRHGTALVDGRADLDRVVGQLAATHGRTERVEVTMLPLADDVLGAVRPAMMALMAAVALLLGVTAANVAGLMLVRAAARRRDVAICLALGISRARLARRLLVECALLAGLASVAALLLAGALLPAVVRLAPADLPRVDDVAIHGRVAGFTFASAAVVAVLCWLAPALGLRSATIDRVLKTGGRGPATGGFGRSARRTLVGLQVATAVVLVAFAGLLHQSVRRLDALDLGFDPRGLVAVEIPAIDGMTPAQGRQYRARVRDAVAAVPGVISAAMAYGRPLKGPIGLDSSWQYEGQTPDAADENPWVNVEAISPDYFATMGTRLAEGRAFSDRDREDTGRVVIVNERLARLAWPGQSAIGKRLRTAATGGVDAGDPQATVVGVVADIRYRDLRAAPLDVYIPVEQSSFVAADLVVRARDSAAPVLSGIRQAIRGQNPDGAIVLTQMEQALAAHQAPWRSNFAFIGLFAALTAALAIIGVYAMLAASVAAQMRDIGVRVALGASARRIVALMMGEGGRVAGAGAVCGLGVTIAGARVARSLLFDVDALDPATLVLAPVFLVVIALAACLVPARRAARVDPAITLRAE